MPRIRRKGHRVAEKLSESQFFDLLLGSGLRAFKTEKERRAAWEANAPMLMDAAKPNKPSAFWSYQAKPPQPEGRCRE